MTQEEKSLSLQDLSARLSYGVKVQVEYDAEEFGKTVEIDEITMIDKYGEEILLYHASEYFSIEELKPYLRPMSSMTKEERNNLRAYCRTQEGIIYDIGVSGAINSPAIIDWLNANHFDYRGLIEKGLAIEAPEGMYEKK